MPITARRTIFQPFEYPLAYNYWERQSQAHWMHTEISLGSDIQDWETKLTENERNAIGMILKGFAQTEVIVNDYWSRRVSKWFPKPEVNMMASAFGYMETVHAKAYAYLNESLGLTDFAAFLDEPTAKAKIDSLIAQKGTSKADIAKSLAVFSGFAEGVQLFSAFAVLMHFQRNNTLKGVGQIVAFSVRDESLHSEAGCWLFRTLVEEDDNLLTDELKAEIYEAARAVVKLEDDFIDQVFKHGDLLVIRDDEPNLTAYDLKQYIRARANTKLVDLGLKPNWTNVNKEALARMEWFDYLTTGVENQDFFAGRVSSYSKNVNEFSQETVFGNDGLANTSGTSDSSGGVSTTG